MIKATKNEDGTITITTDTETAEMIWANAQITTQDPGTNPRTKQISQEIAQALDQAI